jgi:hypothetical protein
MYNKYLYFAKQEISIYTIEKENKSIIQLRNHHRNPGLQLKSKEYIIRINIIDEENTFTFIMIDLFISKVEWIGVTYFKHGSWWEILIEI